MLEGTAALDFVPSEGPESAEGGKALYILLHRVTLANMYSKTFTCVSGCGVARGWGKMN